MKRIIDGLTYNTDTATRIAIGGPEWSDASWEIYQTRHGSFFKILTDHDGESQTLHPLSDAAAQTFLEKYAPEQAEKCFGPFPEAGASERRLTIRVPANLAERVEAAARDKGVSLNSYAIRCFEACATGDGQPARKAQI